MILRRWCFKLLWIFRILHECNKVFLGSTSIIVFLLFVVIEVYESWKSFYVVKVANCSFNRTVYSRKLVLRTLFELLSSSSYFRLSFLTMATPDDTIIKERVLFAIKRYNFINFVRKILITAIFYKRTMVHKTSQGHVSFSLEMA